MAFHDTFKTQIAQAKRKSLSSGKITWRSPSNIALVKYWGKHTSQLPMNASLSLTLSKAATTTTLAYEPKDYDLDEIHVSFEFEGAKNIQFSDRIKSYLHSIQDICPIVKQFYFQISSSNSFPHSAGIASSASAFSALALCLTSLEDLCYSHLEDDHSFRQKASYLARLGSGSACRSIYGYVAEWGRHALLPASSDEVAIQLPELNESCVELCDSILLIDEGKKSVSSSAGHALMETHPYKGARISQAQNNAILLKQLLGVKDYFAAGKIIEEEALSLHALMMTSSPGYFLFKPKTIEIIERLKSWRTETNIPMFFTLDAGPNIHLIYPSEHVDSCRIFIDEIQTKFGINVLHDKVGSGPDQLD